MTGPGPHLSAAELACRDGTPYPDAWWDTRAVKVAWCFEMIRVFCEDRPLTVISAYRTPAHNLAVGGAQESQHLYGLALDLACPDEMTFPAFERAVREAAKRAPIRGIGIDAERRMIHVDARTSAVLHLWWYHNGQVILPSTTPVRA